eukprot:9643342-Alexandrium_andersonii.AAC.1
MAMAALAWVANDAGEPRAAPRSVRGQLMDHGIPADTLQPLLQRWAQHGRGQLEQRMRSYRTDPTQGNAPSAVRVIDDPTPEDDLEQTWGRRAAGRRRPCRWSRNTGGHR